MKIFQAKRKNCNPKPFPEGRVARVARRDERFTLPFGLEDDLIRLGSKELYLI